MKNGQLYTIQFMAKANKPVEIDVALNQAHDPWQQGGFHKKLNLTTQWQSYSFTTENVITDSNLRLNFGAMGFLKGHKIELKEILKNLDDIDPYWVCIPQGSRCAVSNFQMYWYPCRR